MEDLLGARAASALRLADVEARVLGHPRIGTGHLLLGLLRQRHGQAAGALAGLGVQLEGARAAVLSITRGSFNCHGFGTIGTEPVAMMQFWNLMMAVDSPET